jgi:FdhE protein
MAIRTTSLDQLPRDGVSQPDPIILPDPTTLFTRRAARLRLLSTAHPMAEWLSFMAGLADAQARAAVIVMAAPEAWPQANPRTSSGLPSTPSSLTIPLREFTTLTNLPEAAATILRRLPGQNTTALAQAWLNGTLPPSQAGEAVFIAAALQVVHAVRAAALDITTLHLRSERGLCPVCASAPVAGVITAKGRTPGLRYLHCGLCATAWNHVRAVCIGCGESKSLALQEIEGGNGAIKAETCDACHGYAKMLYQAQEPDLDPVADDLASIGLDLMVSDAGWARLAPNPLV